MRPLSRCHIRAHWQPSVSPLPISISLRHPLRNSRGPAASQQAAQTALDADLLTRQTLKEQSELEFLEALGLISNEKGQPEGAADFWRKKEVRINTAMFYKQNKYQNLREEPEGFAKLITVVNNFGASIRGIKGGMAAFLRASLEILGHLPPPLCVPPLPRVSCRRQLDLLCCGSVFFRSCSPGDGALSERTLPGVKKTVLSLIGYFDLDPNRALDLILDRSADPPWVMRCPPHPRQLNAA